MAEFSPPFQFNFEEAFANSEAALAQKYNTSDPSVLAAISAANSLNKTSINVLEGGPSNVQNFNFEKRTNYVPISGTEVKVILEFPDYGTNGKSMIIVLDDVMSLSYSIYRAKPPVTPLGSSSITGFGLGSRTVAGSIIRSVFTVDKLTEFQTQCFQASQEEIKARLQGLNGQMASGLPYKDMIAFMKDDLASFNIHTLSISEVGGFDTPRTRYESIYGAVLINNGQVYSIEDLVTESTVSFQAKAVKSSSNITDYNMGYSTSSSMKTASSLL